MVELVGSGIELKGLSIGKDTWEDFLSSTTRGVMNMRARMRQRREKVLQAVPVLGAIDKKWKSDSKIITDSANELINELNKKVDSEEKITEEDKMLIKKVVSSFRKFSSILLADTIKDQDPFKKAYNPKRMREISIRSMMDFFLTEE